MHQQCFSCSLDGRSLPASQRSLPIARTGFAPRRVTHVHVCHTPSLIWSKSGVGRWAARKGAATCTPTPITSTCSMM
eukprot:SAG25_NODE_249_length_11020_cov_5.841590_9_plen_77_part_00